MTKNCSPFPMNLIYLKKFNNYYNRRLIKFSVLEDYLNEAEDYYLAENQDFNFNDGVSTNKVASFPALQNWNPDYLVVFDNSNKIISRWFVIEAKRQSAGKYILTLRRDVVADYYDVIRNAPVMVERAKIDSDNPFIFNREFANFNQIKTSETLLKDETQTNWIVGYILKDAIGETSKTITASPIISTPSIESLGIELENGERPEEGGAFNFVKTVNIVSGLANGTAGSVAIENFGSVVDTSTGDIQPHSTGSQNQSKYIAWSFYGGDYNTLKSISNQWNERALTFKSEMLSAIDVYFEVKNRRTITQEQYNSVSQYDGKIVYSNQTGKYYRMSIASPASKTIYEDIDPDVSSDIALYNVCESIVAGINTSARRNNADKEEQYEIIYNMQTAKISFVEASAEGELSITLTSGHEHTQDAVYDIFCMKYTEDNLVLAQAISKELTKENVLDLQLLPYCPVRELITSTGIDNTLGSEGVNYFPITKNVGEDSIVIDYLYFAISSNGYFGIELEEPIIASTDAVELKVENECNVYRLCSPNYNGVFEFNAAKNNGINFFNVSFTYKPYSPYIQVAPMFSGLYGQEFRDGRGLVCNGDFSLPTLNSQWQTYEINNKNYENIFNTQIKTMDSMNSLNVLEQTITAPISAATAGLTAGILTGKPAVGVGAAGASMVGGIADIVLGQSRYQKERQLKKDLFNLNLQNIQARPDTLTKISAYNVNNKYFPFLEFYTSTEQEKEALRNKIKYEGMTVGVIGKISDYENDVEEYNYFKGSLIVIDNIDDDFHLVDAISVELEKGIYL